MLVRPAALRVVTVALALVCASAPLTDVVEGRGREVRLRLATTTSTYDTGLLEALLPGFEGQCHCRVEVIAVGTGQALELGRRGDVDVVLVHAREAEDAFVAEGHATERHDVMYNDFVIVGPKTDPAKVSAARTAREAFASIAAARAPFASRGDRSGTHIKELSLWKAAGLGPTSANPWYLSIGQGMGSTLMFAYERSAYTLCDRGTWLSMRSKIPELAVLFGGQSPDNNPDRGLVNHYGVLAINPARHPTVTPRLADAFVTWLLSKPTQRQIGDFGREKFGQTLFYPDSDEYKATRPRAPHRVPPARVA